MYEFQPPPKPGRPVQVILHSRTKDSALDGLPQAVVLDVHGRAECGAELKLKGLGDAEVLPTGEEGAEGRGNLLF